MSANYLEGRTWKGVLLRSGGREIRWYLEGNAYVRTGFLKSCLYTHKNDGRNI